MPPAQTTHFELLVAASPSLVRGCEWKSGSAAKSAARKMTRIGIRRIRRIMSRADHSPEQPFRPRNRPVVSQTVTAGPGIPLKGNIGFPRQIHYR